jgi:hypothetical protein
VCGYSGDLAAIALAVKLDRDAGQARGGKRVENDGLIQFVGFGDRFEIQLVLFEEVVHGLFLSGSEAATMGLDGEGPQPGGSTGNYHFANSGRKVSMDLDYIRRTWMA